MKGITIVADKTRMLRFSINAMIEYKQTRKEDIVQSLGRLENELDFELIRYLFYLGLKHEDKELTEEKVGDVLDILLEENGIEYVANILGEALNKAFGIKETPGEAHLKNQKSH